MRLKSMSRRQRAKRKVLAQLSADCAQRGPLGGPGHMSFGPLRGGFNCAHCSVGASVCICTAGFVTMRKSASFGRTTELQPWQLGILERLDATKMVLATL